MTLQGSSLVLLLLLSPWSPSSLLLLSRPHPLSRSLWYKKQNSLQTPETLHVLRQQRKACGIFSATKQICIICSPGGKFRRAGLLILLPLELMYDELVGDFNWDSANKYRIFYICCEFYAVTQHFNTGTETLMVLLGR